MTPFGLPLGRIAAVAAVRWVTKLISWARSSVAYMPVEMSWMRSDFMAGMRASNACGL
jgi:hypothetical protein